MLYSSEFPDGGKLISKTPGKSGWATTKGIIVRVADKIRLLTLAQQPACASPGPLKIAFNHSAGDVGCQACNFSPPGPWLKLQKSEAESPALVVWLARFQYRILARPQKILHDSWPQLLIWRKGAGQSILEFLYSFSTTDQKILKLERNPERHTEVRSVIPTQGSHVAAHLGSRTRKVTRTLKSDGHA